MTVIGKGIQFHVDAVIKLEVLRRGSKDHQLNAIGINSIKLQLVEEGPTVASFRTKNHQSRSIDGPENLRP